MLLLTSEYTLYFELVIATGHNLQCMCESIITYNYTVNFLFLWVPSFTPREFIKEYAITQSI